MVAKKGDYSDSDSEVMGDDVLCVMIHGDAALSGQGINQETLSMSYLPHYAVGGTLHLIVNNQVLYTYIAPWSHFSFSDLNNTI